LFPTFLPSTLLLYAFVGALTFDPSIYDIAVAFCVVFFFDLGFLSRAEDGAHKC
jgi:hypothetical protein